MHLDQVVYTGPECRATMNNSSPRSKVGLIDHELNGITKVLFLATIVLAAMLVCLKGFDGPWYIYMFRYGTLVDGLEQERKLKTTFSDLFSCSLTSFPSVSV